MKNSIVVNQWLDACAEALACLHSDDPDVLDQLRQSRDASDRATELWRTCHRDGWTIAELDEIYGQRFHVDVAALRR